MLTEFGTVARRAFSPAASLIGRLKYWQKFAVIGVVLVAPLAYVAVSYLGAQHRDTAFAVKERAGVVFLKPATELLARVVDARTLAVGLAAHGAPPAALAPARRQVDAAIAQVDAAHAAAGTLALTQQWAALRREVRDAVAAPTGTPAATLKRYDHLTNGIESLIALDGNNSNMILDPDNDAYYLMDATLNRLTLLDRQRRPVRRPADGGGRQRPADTRHAAAPRGPQGYDRDHGVELRPRLRQRVRQHPLHRDEAATVSAPRPLRSLDRGRHRAALRAARGTPDGAGAGRLGAATIFERAGSRPGDAAGDRSPAHHPRRRLRRPSRRTEAIALIAVLLAMYLFVGFYLSVRASQTAILEGLRGLRENCTDPLADGLDAMATGDLTLAHRRRHAGHRAADARRDGHGDRRGEHHPRASDRLDQFVQRDERAAARR